MDRKSLIVVVISFLLLLAWFPLVNRIWPPKLIPRETNALATASNQPAAGGVVASNVVPVLTAARTNLMDVKPPVPSTVPEVVEVLETAEAKYTFTSHGGGLKRVEFKKYPLNVGGRKKAAAGPNEWASLNDQAPLPLLALLGDAALTGDGVFALKKMGAGLLMEQELPNGLKLIKAFRPESNYLLRVAVRMENLSGQAVTLPAQQWAAGTTTPLGPMDDGLLMGFYHYDGQKAEHQDVSAFGQGGGCSFRAPLTHYESAGGDVHWSAVHNQFFTLIVVPKAPAMRLLAQRVDFPPPGPAELQIHPRANRHPYGVQTALLYLGTVLGTASTNNFLEREFTLYAGPREYHTLARLGAAMTNKLDLVMGYDGFSGFFAKGLLLSMNWIHEVFGLPYGWAIIVITILIKLLFWPLTQASTKSMKRMAALQPQMKALQEKYKDEPAKMNQKLMEFMKEHKVSPLGGCLPMLIQIPVFIGFYRMIQNAIELRGATFLWVNDLSRPDTVFEVGGFPINPLPILMGATMIWQARMTPVSPGMDPVQQKIMKYMPLIFMVFLYNMSAGLTLYWTVQNLLTIAQMKLTKTNEAESAAPAPVMATKKTK